MYIQSASDRIEKENMQIKSSWRVLMCKYNLYKQNNQQMCRKHQQTGDRWASVRDSLYCVACMFQSRHSLDTRGSPVIYWMKVLAQVNTRTKSYKFLLLSVFKSINCIYTYMGAGYIQRKVAKRDRPSSVERGCGRGCVVGGSYQEVKC